ncbi:hypothetical protein CWT12_04150 [Actinomyces sp. 432]|nr:hypothetical protein CWT12_04150 [Actinomyces sp. 432]
MCQRSPAQPNCSAGSIGARYAKIPGVPCPSGRIRTTRHQEAGMSKRGRKRRSRAKNSANHGKRPNA